MEYILRSPLQVLYLTLCLQSDAESIQCIVGKATALSSGFHRSLECSQPPCLWHLREA